MEAIIYNQKGEEVGKVSLPEKVFSAKWNTDLVHQVVEGMRSNARTRTTDTKDRSEVSGGGKKPWKQKGTGRARHGSTRSPIWVGGGVAHGPRKDKNYKKKISKKMRAKALFSVLSKKLKEGNLVFVDSLETPQIKTKSALEIMFNLSKAVGGADFAKSSKPRVLVAIDERSESKEKSFRNIPSLDLAFVKNLNPLDVLSHKYLLIENPEKSVEFLASRG